MTQIKSRGHRGKKLFAIVLPVAVSECHHVNGVDQNDPINNQHWVKAELQNTETKILEVRVWAEDDKEALYKLRHALERSIERY